MKKMQSKPFTMKIAIVGAGFAGAVAYSILKTKGHDVALFEKSRGAGGRCATRYYKKINIDHGTSYFTPKSKEFASFCRSLGQDILTPLESSFFPTKAMNSICSSLIDKADLYTNTQITACKKTEKGWKLFSKNKECFKGFDLLLLAIPAPNVLDLEIALPKKIQNALQKINYESIATLMLYSKDNNKLPKSFFEADIFKKVINNSLKYGYKECSSYLLHLNSVHMQRLNIYSKKDVKTKAVAFIEQQMQYSLQEHFTIIPHLWRYAFVKIQSKEPFFYTQSFNLGLCGDYFGKENLESAYFSAKELCTKF